jgi:hypothetical protein
MARIDPVLEGFAPPHLRPASALVALLVAPWSPPCSGPWW